MTNESPAPTPSTEAALIDERAVEMAIAARDYLRTEGSGAEGRDMIATATLPGGAMLVTDALIREECAIEHGVHEMIREHRQDAIEAAANLAADALLTLAHLLAHTCQGCGCTDEAGCMEVCSWIKSGLCTSCGPDADPETDPLDDYDRSTHFQAAIAAATPEADNAH